MKFRIHFTKDNIEDDFDIEAESIDEVKELTKEQTDKRFLTEKENNLWSERL